MGFFDLNIPYPEPNPKTSKSTIENNRTRLVVKAMELGYTGIAYNRTMKGIMSDHHRCSITPLSLSSLLNIVPFLSSSVKLHRDLLGVSNSTPFRQYTRLTVCVENPLQANALNDGNPILKTYDLVAVKPLNQTAFDIACERMSVDIISIDFSAKLPFRLKQSMVKIATERGIVFEVSYSGLIADVQLRRQVISNAKLLIDWTRGRDIVFSSAASSVNELRGPCDVGNLLLLTGLSKEKAKAAISKNCRVLLANALKRKRFYKEAIKVDVLSSHSKEARHQELLKWDPLSSGEGDILLDDIEKSCLAPCKASKSAKAIDFDSVVDSLPSQGYLVQDFLRANDAFPISATNKVNFAPVAQNVNQSTPVPDNLTEKPNKPDVCTKQDEISALDGITKHHIVRCGNIFEKNIHNGTSEPFHSKEIDTGTNGANSEVTNSIDSDVLMDDMDFTPSCEASKVVKATNGNLLPVAEKVNQSKHVLNNSTEQSNRLVVSQEQDEKSASDTLTTHHDVSCVNVFEKNINNGTIEALNSKVEIDTRTNASKLVLQTSIDSDVDCSPSNALGTIKPHENEELLRSSDDRHNIDEKVEICKPSTSIIFPAPVHEKDSEKNNDVNLNAHFSTMHENLSKEDFKIAEHTVLDMKTSTCETSIEDGQFDKREPDAIEIDEMPHQAPFDEMKMEDDSTVAIDSLPEIMMEDKKFVEVSADSDRLASVQSVSGRLRVKRRTPPTFPLKRLLNMVPFKKKGKKVKRRTNPKN